jgi:hypothetical protein
MRPFRLDARINQVRTSKADSTGRRSRRARVGVEAMEPRLSLSGFTSSVATIRAFNPQPDPPVGRAAIIAI